MTTVLSNEIESHFKALGVDSVVAYKLWCYRHGLDTGLDKTPDEREAERALVKAERPDPDINPRHNARRAEFIARIFKGELQNETVSDLLFRIRAMYNNLAGDPDAQQALGRLVLHVKKYGDLMRPARACKRFGHTVVNTYIAALEQLARNHADWIRPVADWRPYRGTHRQRGSKPARQFNSLARHLLAKYDVPEFFDSAFLQGNTPQARQQQAWFKHIGMGQNIRTADVPMRITKRMAHLLLQQRGAHHTIVQALRKVQYEAYGGNPSSARELAHGPLGETFDNEEFWATVVQFLANQPFLDRSYLNPIIDYIRNQKFTPRRVPQPDGTEVEAPPLHPNFCMKGRSINKLIRQVDLWHQELTGMEDVAFETWQSSGFREFEHVSLDPEIRRNIQWTVHELITSQQLYAEGRIMHHCAGSYTKRCAAGEKSLWSLRALDLDAAEEHQVREHVLTIEVDNKKKAVVQNAGKFNLKPFGKKHLAQQRRTGNIYLHLLRQAPTVMRLWMDREGLSRG